MDNRESIAMYYF